VLKGNSGQKLSTSPQRLAQTMLLVQITFNNLAQIVAADPERQAQTKGKWNETCSWV
jgi:hypothetical protein